MTKPVIGLIPGLTPEDHEFTAMPAYRFEFIKEQYYEVLEQNGGVPIILPLTEHEENLDSYFSLIDGLMLAGGEDINPEVYGEPLDPLCKPLMPRRDSFEIKMIQTAISKHVPILGVCRGLQILNVSCGGTLYQDLSHHPGAGNHSQIGVFDFSTRHNVNIVKGTQFHRIIGSTTIETNTAHHQAIKHVGNGLVVAATSPDGVIEAIEGSGFTLAVQWHPESWPLDPVSRNLFRAFIKAGLAYKTGRKIGQ